VYHVLALLALLSCVGPDQPASSAAAKITDLVPADSLVMYAAKPYGWLDAASRPAKEGEEPKTGGFSIASIVSILNAAGMIPDEGQVFADIASAMPLLGRFEHAVLLVDVSSKVIELRADPQDSAPAKRSLRLKSLQTAIVFRTAGNDHAVLEQLDRVVGRYTNRDVAELSSLKAGDDSYQRLRDDRLPGWAVWEWGRLGEFFVVSFGKGTFEQIALAYRGKTPRLSADSWFQAASAKTHGDRAQAQWFIAFSRLKDALGEAAEGRVSRVAAELKADDMTHDLWTIGQEGRSLTWYRCYRRNGLDVMHRYSDPANYSQRHMRIVPDEASRLAIINVPTRWLVDNLPRAWLASQSEGNVRKWQRAWKRLEQETGTDISRGLIEHLGETVVIFDYPRHPLDIPFALTVAIEIDDPAAVRMATDALLSAWGQYLDERAERNQTVLVRVYVKHDDDGVWYLQAGILGPALMVTDHYVVWSWSPQALRDALKHIERTE